MSRNNKLLIVTSLLGLCLIVFIFLKFSLETSKTPSPTNPFVMDEHTFYPSQFRVSTTTLLYKNPEIGISFEHPENIVVTAEGAKLIISPIPSDSPQRQSSLMMGSMYVSLIKQSALGETERSLLASIQTSRDIYFKEHKARLLVTEPSEYAGDRWIYILVETGADTLNIHYMEDSIFSKIYEQVLESMKFI